MSCGRFPRGPRSGKSGAVNERDQFLQSQLPSILQPGEQVMHVGVVRRQPGLLMQMLLVGGLLLFLMTKTYYAVLTNRRLILIRAGTSFWSGRPTLENRGVESFDVAQLRDCTTSGIANNRSMTFVFADGTKHKVRISPWFETVTGNKAFFENVPNLIKSGQLAAGAGAGAPQMGMGGGMQPQQQMGGYGQPQQPQQMGAYGGTPSQQPPQPQMSGYGAPPSAGPAQLGPGARVMVTWTDGNRYPGTVVQAQGGHVLCQMDGGQQQWVPAQNVSAA